MKMIDSYIDYGKYCFNTSSDGPALVFFLLHFVLFLILVGIDIFFTKGILLLLLIFTLLVVLSRVFYKQFQDYQDSKK